MIMSVGIALSIKAGLGTSPISSLPCALNAALPLSVGILTCIMHIIMVILQILIERKNYPLIQLLQLPVGIAFGFAIDIALWLISWWEPSSYFEAVLGCLLGVLVVAFGVACEVVADGIPLCGEGVVIAICRTFGTVFGKTKVIFDLTLVILAVISSLVLVGQVVGVREGTLLAAFSVGAIARPMICRMKSPMEKFFTWNW